jgi:hypothetical protein
LRIQDRHDKARSSRDYVHSAAYRQSLIGMIGTDPELHGDQARDFLPRMDANERE